MNTASKPRIVTERAEMNRLVREARKNGKRVGIVPTMGAFHPGHLSLVQASITECDQTVVTVFVNPTQFLPNEDLSRYPRNLPEDLRKLAPYPVEFVFAPSRHDVYRPGHSTYVEPPEVSRRWEGETRPGHFRGVATIVLKLFHIIPADIAYFGQKDFQQSLVVRRMVEDLDLDIAIRVCPTVREPDGLAWSSRNCYLSAEERLQAAALYRSLNLADKLVRQGERNASAIKKQVKQQLNSAGIRQIDYVAIVSPETMQDVDTVRGSTLVAVAAHVGKTRLIDNRLIG